MVELSGIEPLPPLPVRPQQSEDAQTKDSKQARRPRPRIGGAERDRTADPLLAKQVLSQLSYSP